MIDGMKLVVLGGTVETARRVASSGWYVLATHHLVSLTYLIIPHQLIRTCTTTSRRRGPGHISLTVGIIFSGPVSQ